MKIGQDRNAKRLRRPVEIDAFFNDGQARGLEPKRANRQEQYRDDPGTQQPDNAPPDFPTSR